MREAPSIALITALQDLGAWVRVYDPADIQAAKNLLPSIEYADNAYSCASGTDGLVIVPEWEQFRAPSISSGSSS